MLGDEEGVADFDHAVLVDIGLAEPVGAGVRLLPEPHDCLEDEVGVGVDGVLLRRGVAAAEGPDQREGIISGRGVGEGGRCCEGDSGIAECEPGSKGIVNDDRLGALVLKKGPGPPTRYRFTLP